MQNIINDISFDNLPAKWQDFDFGIENLELANDYIVKIPLGYLLLV